MIIIVVGMPGSGKDVFVQIAKSLGFEYIRMGDVVRHYASASGIASTDVEIGGFANSEREKHGAAVWAERTLARMPAGDVVIDGSRSIDEISLFKRELGPSLKVVAVLADRAQRFFRLSQRRRADDPTTERDLEQRDGRELSWGIDRAIASAEISIGNDGSLEEFMSKARMLLEDMLNGHGKSI
jgi:dephospho-CoA kinase